MEKFCDIFTLRPSDLITIDLVLMDNFCPCFRKTNFLIIIRNRLIVTIVQDIATKSCENL